MAFKSSRIEILFIPFKFAIVTLNTFSHSVHLHVVKWEMFFLFFFFLGYNSIEFSAKADSNLLQESCKKEILTRYL